MKKILSIFMLLVVVIVASGCSTDKEHATVMVSTSDGAVEVYESYSEKGMNWTGQRAAIEYAIEVKLPTDGTVTYVFKCETCGDEQSEEISEAIGKLLSCNCEGEMKEYFCLKVQK